MPWYATTYPSGKNVYGTSLFAKEPTEAEHIAKIRQIGERITGPGVQLIPLSIKWVEHLKSSSIDRAQRLHDAIFFMFIAENSGARLASGEPHSLSDEGLIHRMSHWAASPGDYGVFEVFLNRVRNIEPFIPGYTDGN